MTQIVTRTVPAAPVAALGAAGLPPLLARLYAARGLTGAADLETALSALLPPRRLLNAGRMAALVADAIAAGKKLTIVADYDADGATGCALGLRALRAFGAHVDYLVPNRFEYGYGLTPEIAELAHRLQQPDILITVDNGIASVEGVARANALGMQVLVTDHHLPAAVLPDALCIVNPNQPGCDFPSKHLAGVGVMFYLMLALRAELRARGAYPADGGPNLSALLDLVALGTVADVARLDANNRILVGAGVERIRAGKTWPGIAALLEVAGRDPRRAGGYDLGFVLGPRLNAAGRLDDMSAGIECLATDDAEKAREIAQALDALNRERRGIEAGMQEEAFAALAAVGEQEHGEDYALSLHNPGWHPGVIGILASRLRDRYHRPAFAFAPGGADGGDELKGSGRSIPGLHLRDALDRVDKRAPGLILRFGGHAAAAGLSLRPDGFEAFRDAFEAVARELLTPADLARVIETDGALATAELSLETAALLERTLWGQGFPPPLFDGVFTVARQHIVGARHLKLALRTERAENAQGADGGEYEAMLFGDTGPLPERLRAVYRVGVNEYAGARSLQLTLEHWQPV